MGGAAFALIANICIAALFSITFGILGVGHARYRRLLWFTASYAVGIGTPASELLISWVARPAPFIALSYITFGLALHIMACALAVFYRSPIPWRLLVPLLAATLGIRWAIWGGARGTLAYELIYQLPFATVTAVCAAIVLRASRRGGFDLILAGMFLLSALHFLSKPFAAVTLGVGATAQAYASSTYALFSQTGTAALLVATGLVLLLVVVRDMLDDERQHAITDTLSGLLNRRGFEERAPHALAAGTRQGRRAALLMFDLDRFKLINDTLGHAAGDRVIRAFSSLLRREAPDEALICRLGGEEFVLLLPDADAGRALELGEAIRQALRRGTPAGDADTPPITTSIGATVQRPGSSLDELLHEADAALYAAKQAGRDRIHLYGQDAQAAIG